MRIHQRRKRNNPHGLVGTEAAAAAALQANSKNFGYPPSGFLTPVEHSLLYNMLSAPDVYPAEAVRDAIEQEDFTEYLATKQVNSVNSTNEAPQHVTSYAQLSALLALSAEKWPPPTNNNNNNIGEEESSSSSSNNDSIPQVLCKALLQTVVKHAAEHDLDRENEVQELLQPLETLQQKKGNNTFLAIVLPTYVGYAASLATANPVPVLLGAMATQALSVKVMAKEHAENSNLQDLKTSTQRMADAETTSLLDETY